MMATELPPLQVTGVFDASLPAVQWCLTLASCELELLGKAAESVVAASASSASGTLDLQAITRSAYEVAASPFGARIESLRGPLLHGHGFMLLKGLPLDAWGTTKSAAAFLITSRLLGPLCAQNAAGHVLGHVTDLGVSSTDPSVRVYQTNERQTFHTDSCDIVGLLCLQPAVSGGLSAVVSAGAIYNRMLLQRPDLLQILLEPIATDRRGETPAGMEPFFMVPVFCYCEGELSVMYQRQYIDSAQRFERAPRLTPAHVEALDLFDSIANDASLHVTAALERGDMQLVHNHSLLHDRSAFVDDPARKRHLLRAWVAAEGARPLPPVFCERFGSVEVGARGGVHIEGVTPVANLRPPPPAAK